MLLCLGYCDVIEHLVCYKWVVKERERYGEKWSKQWAQEQARQKILYELPSIVAAHSFPCNTEMFPSWSNYLRQLLSTGKNSLLDEYFTVLYSL